MKVVLLQTPSPPGMNVKRDYAGGMGVADPSPRTGYGHDPGYIALPYMSLLYAVAVLREKGFDVAFVDGQAENLDLDATVEKVKSEEPHALIGVVNLPSIYGDLELLKTVKSRVPGLKTVAIGAIVDPLFDEIAASGAVDAAVRGDPETVLPGLLKEMERAEKGEDAGGKGFALREGILTNTAMGRVENLDALPRLPYELVPLDRYWYHGFGKDVRYAAVFASRGCPYRCYYCPYPMGFGGRIVYRDPVRVVDEIEDLQQAFSVKGILFRDQVFSMDKERTIALCDEIMRRGLKFSWVVETRLDRVDEEILRKMKDAGCTRIHYGLESGDPEMFARVGKDGADGDMDALAENFRTTERVGIHPHMFVLVGLIGETWDTIRGTIATIRKIKPLTLQVAVVTPYPGTELFAQMEEKGLLLTRDWSRYTGFEAIVRTEALSPEDLLSARELIIREHGRAVAAKRWRQRAVL
ncbi:MAG: radical SAM protein, partial [Lentisphaerae bacterium]|nr:radical SAM protein [Lentisphaerota bacterium]